MSYKDYSFISNMVSMFATGLPIFLFIRFVIKPKTIKINLLILNGSFVISFVILLTLIYIYVNSLSLLPILYGCLEGIFMGTYSAISPNVVKRNKH